MERERSCHLFRGSENYPDLKKDEFYCQLDGSRTECEGGVSFCEKPDAFREYFRQRLDEYKKREDEKE